jgi:hypothetical protein
MMNKFVKTKTKYLFKSKKYSFFKICFDCLFILCENPKTTEYINEIEFELIKYFLQMNIDNGSTSFRNQSLSLLKKVFWFFFINKLIYLLFLKHFIRIKDSWLLCARQKLKNIDQNFDELTQRYRVCFLN